MIPRCAYAEDKEKAGPGSKTVIVLAATNTPWDLDEVRFIIIGRIEHHFDIYSFV